MSTFTNTDSTIDSRDIIERIEELEALIADESTNADFLEWCQEYDTLTTLAEECEQYSDDWEYGSTLIHRDYFEEYMNDMVADCYELPKDMPYWMSVTYDYDALEEDYTSVNFDGEEYLIR